MAKDEEKLPSFANPLIAAYTNRIRFSTSCVTRIHGTADWLIILTLSGEGRVTCGTKDKRPRRGDIFIYKPHTYQNYGGVGKRWEYVWAHFVPRLEWHAYMQWAEVAPGLAWLNVSEAPCFPEIINEMSKVPARLHSSLPRGVDFAMNALEEVLLLCDSVNPQASDKRVDSRVLTAMEYLCANLSEKITLCEVAAASHLSVSRLSYLFRQEMGLSPFAYLESQRMQRAEERLALTVEPVSEIARSLGFESLFYFSRRFKKCTGLGPRAYRQEHGR